jgi:VWFA-related protein
MGKAGCCVLVLLCAFALGASGQQAAVTVPGSAVTPPTPAAVPTHISIDVVVEGKDGKPVPELEPTDLTLLDNGQPRKVLAFRRTDGGTGNRVDLPEEVIIVLDSVNMPYQAVTLLRLQVEKFLRANGGHLAQPTSVFVFASEGLRVQPTPSKDGNALADAINTSVGTVRSRGSAAGDYGLAEQFQTSVQTLNSIAENEKRKPGRKMVIWLGNGWPLLNQRQFESVKTNELERQYFDDILRLSKGLREARVSLYLVYTLNSADDRYLFEDYLKPVKEFHKANAGNVSAQVLAQQTGGRVMEPSNDIAGQIAACIGDIGTYYTLIFGVAPAAEPNEYHELKVEVGRSGLSGRTTTSYYNQP